MMRSFDPLMITAVAGLLLDSACTLELDDGPSPFGTASASASAGPASSGGTTGSTGFEEEGTEPQNSVPSSAGDPVGSSSDTGAVGDTTGGDGSPDPDDTGDGSGDPPEPSACCGIEAGPGCVDPVIEACVCAADDWCCSTQWDIACVVGVEDLGCGECGIEDDIASCEALCTTLVQCDPSLGYDTVGQCMEQECLGLLDQAQADGPACLEALTRYNACIGVLSCGAFDDYLEHAPGFPCEGFEQTLFDSCPFIGG